MSNRATTLRRFGLTLTYLCVGVYSYVILLFAGPGVRQDDGTCPAHGNWVVFEAALIGAAVVVALCSVLLGRGRAGRVAERTAALLAGCALIVLAALFIFGVGRVFCE